MTSKQSILEVKIDPSGARLGAAQATKAYSDFATKFDKNTSRIQASFDKFVVATKNANSKMLRKMTASWSKFSKFVKDRAIKGMKDSFLSAMRALTRGAGTLISILGPAGVVGAINEVIQAGLKIQKFAVTFSVVSGSMREGRKELQGLVEMTQKLGSSFEASAAPAAKFFAASKDALLSTDIREIFKSFSEVSVALQLNKQEVTGVFLALQQIASKGKVSMEELRLQLAERVPGAMTFAAQSMGMSMVDFEEAVRKGTINSSEFLINFGKTLHEAFGPAAALASELGQSSINRFDTALTLFLNKISEMGVLKGFQNFLDSFREKFLENSKAAEVLGTAITKVIERFTTFIKNMDDESIMTTVVFIANAFVRIYNTILDIIPNMKTIADTLRTAGKFAGVILEAFAPKAEKSEFEVQQEKVTALFDKLTELNRLFDMNKNAAIEAGSSAKKAFEATTEYQIAAEQIMGVENALRLTIMQLDKLRTKSVETAKVVASSIGEKAELFTAADFASKGKSKPNVAASTATGITEKEIASKMTTIRGFIKDSNDLLNKSTTMTLIAVDKVADARVIMADTEKDMNAIYELAANTSGDVLLRDQLINSQKLVTATTAFVEAREEFEDLFAAARDKENTRLTDMTNGEIESMTEFLSFGREAIKEDLILRQTDVQDAADAKLMTQSNANELIEVMELKHLAKMGSLRAEYALAQKTFDNQTNAQRAKSLLGDIIKSTGVVASGNKKLFEINKKARIAQAAMELPAAVMSSFARGGGFPWGLIPAGITLASGLANIQQIKSSNFGGSGGSASVGGGGGGGSAPTPTAPAVIPPASDAIFNSTQGGAEANVVDSSSQGNLVVNFKVDTVDAKGFNRIVESNKQVLTRVIQDAYTERGVRGGPIA